MKLKKLIVKNFRGLKGDQNVIDFENSDIIFLIGKNNNGKSTFLHAYNFFVEPKTKAVLSDFCNKDNSVPIEISGIFVVEKDDEKDKTLQKNDPDWINKWVDEEGFIKIKKVWSNESEEGKKETFNPSTKEFEEGGFGGFDTLLKRYAPTAIYINAISDPQELEKQINDIITKNHIKKLETQYSDKYTSIIESLNELKNEISKSDDINDINEKMNGFFSNIFPKLKLEIYSIPDSGIDISKTLKSTHGLSVTELEVLENVYDLKNNGHGVMRQAFFSFLSTLGANLNEKRKEYLILFEEPELYLHPEAIFSLRDQLYKLAQNSPFQILCATHSSLMIDTSKPHSSLVRLAKESNRNTKTYQVEFDIFEGEEKSQLQMINRFNPHICECFFAEEVVLVEGDTEAIIYRELIERFFKDQKDVFVLNTGSKANMVFYQKILTHFGIKHIIVHDADSPTYLTKDNKEKINAMWTYNNSIWDQINSSNNEIQDISRRYVHISNFEEAHGYKENKSKGKPLSAYEFSKSIPYESNLPCIKFLKDLFSDSQINHTQEEVESVYGDIKNVDVEKEKVPTKFHHSQV
ncbi:putative ATP-dependent endonuclease of OLD family [Scopulibacillus darangshiensis]|uniref:Putative ATP-dependent endonuclease of OLD family n=1 Tax=Scopulibacillus darangshiensis TaxID=442528 RepID=A0A4R2P4J0_9BACL|nr:AAA family ATPase [Scopulibacillus darangshiensis]TCP29567.1 putative ATP-dependent endonuclease of OLD family [Scopulibacillus darangshiensis]